MGLSIVQGLSDFLGLSRGQGLTMGNGLSEDNPSPFPFGAFQFPDGTYFQMPSDPFLVFPSS